jgi:hypothetical protein
MNEDIKKRLAYAENHNLFDAHYINDMKTLLEQNDRLTKELNLLRKAPSID